MAHPKTRIQPRDFPHRPVIILALCMTVNAYAVVNLFPYVGIMVKDLVGLESTNEAGEETSIILV